MNATKTKEPRTTPSPRTLVKVAVVDDDDDFRDALKVLLETTAGLQCAGLYASAETALQEIPNAPPDLVLLDIRMGGMSGLECAERLKTILPELKIAILSAFMERNLVLQAIATGVCGYLIKGMSAAELVGVIFSMASGNAHLPPAVQQEILAAFHSFNHGAAGGLSHREREVLLLFFQGRSDKEIASDLKISEATVRTHVRDLFRKLGVHSRRDAVAAFLGLP